MRLRPVRIAIRKAGMSTSSPAAQVPSPIRKAPLSERIKPYTVPYYLTVAGVIGAITAGFVVVIALLILVVANFNVLGWIE